MAGFDHRLPANDAGRDLRLEHRHTRVGLILFALYLLAYGAYVVVNAFAPAWMDVVPFLGLNLAVSSGLGLIVGALALALVYAWLCGQPGGGAE